MVYGSYIQEFYLNVSKKLVTLQKPHKPKIDMDNTSKTIRKNNELIEARYRLSLNEQRLVLLLASDISNDDEAFKDYEIRVTDFARMFDLASDKDLYSKVEQAADTLLGKIITLKNDREIEKTVWFSYVHYVKGSGTVKVRFDKSLKPYLLQLKNCGHYTQYKLNYVINFKSQYSIRLYELLKMHAFKAKEGKFERNFEINELRLTLGIAKKEYKIFNNFRVRVIEPAVEEVIAQTDLDIEEVRYERVRNKVVSIRFFVAIRQSKPNSQIIDTELTQAIKNEPIIDHLVKLGFAIETARRYKNKYGIKHLERNIAYTLAKQQEGLVKDFPAYLNKAITEDMGGAWMVVKTKQEEEKAVKQTQAQAREKEAELAHLKRLAELGGVSVESLKKF